MNDEPDEIEVERGAEIDRRFWLAETGWARARAIAFETGVDRETLTEAQAIALVTEIVGIA